MTPKRYVILLGPHAPLCERARAQGLGVIVLDVAARLAPGVLELADHVILTDYTDVDLTTAILKPWCERLDVAGVLSLTEYGLLAAARLNERLGFTDNTVLAVDRTVNKQRMRERLSGDERFALPAKLANDATQVQEFAAAFGYPVLLKPPDGAGSENIVLLRDRSDHDFWARTLPAFPVLAERFVTGPEYSIEAYSTRGAHVIVAITEKTLHPQDGNAFVELGHTIPATVSNEVRTELEEFACAFLDRMDLQWGLTHTEVILTAAGPVVVETHTRNGGDRITELVQAATGVDLLAVAVAIRARATVPASLSLPSSTGGAAVRFLIPGVGVVEAVHGRDTAAGMPGVVEVAVSVQVGEVLGPLRSSDDRAGLVVATGPDGRTAMARAASAAAAVQFVLGTTPSAALDRSPA
jgi:biotin carboxylase